MDQAKLAGKFAKLQQSDLFQESMEGLLFGGTAGVSLLGTDTPLSEVALQTAGAIGGGIGIGLAGKHIGAAIGKRLHPVALKNQQGILANIGRTTGQKTLAKGATESLRYQKGLIKQELKNQTSKVLLDEALQNPQQFTQKYGVSAEDFKKYNNAVKISGQVQAGLETLEALSPEQRKELTSQVKTTMNQGFNQVEELIANQSAANVDANLKKMAQMPSAQTEIPGMDMKIGDVIESLLKKPNEITGEHIGRAVGRFAGDEIGAVTGMQLGALAAGTLGIKNEKDKQLETYQELYGKLPV
jgi:hypothetical protein